MSHVLLRNQPAGFSGTCIRERRPVVLPLLQGLLYLPKTPAVCYSKKMVAREYSTLSQVSGGIWENTAATPMLPKCSSEERLACAQFLRDESLVSGQGQLLFIVER
jgi:hypothetical protein